MNRAMVALLLALTGQSPDAPPSPDVSSPSAPAGRPVLSQGRLLGAWRDAAATSGGGFEVAFSAGTRPGTVFGHFIFDEGQGARTLRQLGRVAADRVSFVLADGREITLRLDAGGRRLLGTIVQRGRESAIELSRLRQRD
jgi:hypothetical protein